MLSAKQGGIKCHFLSLWYDSNWDLTLVSWTIDEHWLMAWFNIVCVCVCIYIYGSSESHQRGDISTLNGGSLKLLDTLTYLRSSVLSTKNDINTRLAKAWVAIDRLSVIWKSDLSNKIKCIFFQAVVMSILLYGCNTWTLTKHMKKMMVIAQEGYKLY